MTYKLWIINKYFPGARKAQLHLVKIYFGTSTFKEITQDAKTNFVSMISMIGGTFGLFTGFSILSGVEILFFIGKTCVTYLKNLKTTKNAIF